MGDYVNFVGDEARFVGKVRPAAHRHFQSFVHHVVRNPPDHVVLDFSQCAGAFPNAMIPIVADVTRLRLRGIHAHFVSPQDELTRKLFMRTNWAHFLDPDHFHPSDGISDRHLAVVSFRDSDEQQRAVNGFLDVAMRTLELDRATLGGLEWAINEITDNVLNHADSTAGGLVQLATLKDRLAFCVADIGQGILGSLRQAYPNLRSDEAAIGTAVRAGVTRNRDIGQGNGISGTLKLATATRGRFSITSGSSEMCWAEDGAADTNRLKHPFNGTIVDVQLRTDVRINIAQVLAEGTNTPAYQPTDFIETQYLAENCRELRLSVNKETVGFGTRRAGEQIRMKCNNLLNAEPGCPLVIDWDGIQMIASSYADEFIGKLYWELGPMNFMGRVKQVNIAPVVQQLLDRAILQRTHQMMTGGGPQNG